MRMDKFVPYEVAVRGFIAVYAQALILAYFVPSHLLCIKALFGNFLFDLIRLPKLLVIIQFIVEFC